MVKNAVPGGPWGVVLFATTVVLYFEGGGGFKLGLLSRDEGTNGPFLVWDGTRIEFGSAAHRPEAGYTKQGQVSPETTVALYLGTYLLVVL